jgi:hypothetical protein
LIQYPWKKKRLFPPEREKIMKDSIHRLIKARQAELLESARIAQLLQAARSELLARAAQQQAHAASEDSSHDLPKYVLAPGQGEEVLKSPHTPQLLRAAKKDDEKVDDMEYAIFFKRSIF